MEGDRNEFYALVSPGGLKIGRRLKDSSTRRRSETGSPTGRDKRPIREFSNGSRQRMRWALNALPWMMITDDLGMRLAMLTLTYPKAFPADGKQVTAHRRAFIQRWHRKFGPAYGAWAREWQDRGAPHFHLYVGTPTDAVIERDGFQHHWGWALENWYDVVKSGDAAHRERGVHYRPCVFDGYDVRSSQQIADYFWRESGKVIQKKVPPGYENPGRFWGYFGPGFKPIEAEAELQRREYIEMRRPMRALRDKKAGKRVQPLRGLDGLYVLSQDGRALAGQLLPWARQEGQAHGPERLRWRRSPRRPDAGVEESWWFGEDSVESDEDAALSAAVAAHEAELDARDAYMDALVAEHERRMANEELADERAAAAYFRTFGIDPVEARARQRRGGPVADWQAYVRGLKSDRHPRG